MIGDRVKEIAYRPLGLTETSEKGATKPDEIKLAFSADPQSTPS